MPATSNRARRLRRRGFEEGVEIGGLVGGNLAGWHDSVADGVVDTDPARVRVGVIEAGGEGSESGPEGAGAADRPRMVLNGRLPFAAEESQAGQTHAYEAESSGFGSEGWG